MKKYLVSIDYGNAKSISYSDLVSLSFAAGTPDDYAEHNYYFTEPIAS